MSDRHLSASQLVALEDRFAAHNYHPLPVVLARGEGAYVYDVDGKCYLDCLAAYSAVNQGHNHPRIVAALVEQAKRLALTSRAFHNDRFGPFCEKFSKLTGYQKVLMMNTGAEAVETAIKAARRHAYQKRSLPADRARIIVFDENFHGRTTTIVGFSSDENSRAGFGPFPPGFTRVRYGDLAAVEAAMGPDVAAILVEPVQGEAGVIVPPRDFLPGLRRLCDRYGALLICDEIQSGLGRTGSLFAHHASGVHPDGVIVGKALSGGLYPVSAFLADDAVMSVFTPGSHGSTYGGNPLACAVAEAALDVLIEENLCERSRDLGEVFAEALRAIDSPKIKEIRAAGLWVGLELHPHAGKARGYCETLMREGLLCKDTHDLTIRIAPTLVVRAEALEEAASTIARVLRA